MEDAFYYRMRSVVGELEYIEKQFKDGGFTREVTSDGRRRQFRELVARASRSVAAVKSEVGDELRPEFAVAPER